METSWILISRKQHRTLRTRYTRVYRYRDISQSRVWARNVAVKGWYRTVQSLPTVREDEGWPTDNGMFVADDELGLFPQSRSRGLLEQPQTRGMSESALLPSTPPFSSSLALLLWVMSQTIYAFPSDEGARSAEYVCLQLYHVVSRLDVSILGVLITCHYYLGCLKLGLFTRRIHNKKNLLWNEDWELYTLFVEM